ncbi:MAG TPA: LysM peptidoglycan-binding domain-containing M23 family metallopeptidase [Anaerolineae bacterium]|nr:LysM peptidoglycan-binding domain-containing M23 family metallopeptidase [Anaerolineae bacterium]
MSEIELVPRRAARRLTQPLVEANLVKSIEARRKNTPTLEASARVTTSVVSVSNTDWVELTPSSFGSLFARLFARTAVQFSGTAWLATGDRAKATMLRFISHIVILAVVLGAAVIAGSTHTPRVLAGNTINSVQRPAAADETFFGEGGPIVIDQLSVSPMANPFTIVPNRPRKDIVVYMVQSNDTLSQIAYLYGLKPETVLWANTDILHDDPHYLTPGMELKIPPVDGIIYTVKAGDTVDDIAKKFKTSADAIYTDGVLWNQLKPGQLPVVGSVLIVPGGSRDFQIVNLVAQTFFSSQSSSGYCKNVAPGLIGTGTFIWPIQQHWVSGNNYAPWHPGIDLAAHTGDQVYAVDNGIVIYAGWNNSGYGNLVVIDHGNGWISYYAHNSIILVTCGQNVAQGTVISAAGSTGRSTGPHLHIETRFNDVPQNPFNVLPPP